MLAVVTVGILVVAGTLVALNRWDPMPPSGRCTATAGGSSHSYAADQARNAALTTAVGMDRGLPARAVSIALATAYQESKLRNIDYGDRDSLGLFQQRPSQGWGSEEEIQDPVYSANRFYQELETLDYLSMPINDAAQTVQRSGHPQAYAAHEAEGRIFASTLTGHSGLALTCDLARAKQPGDPQALAAALERQAPHLTGTDGPVATSLAESAALGPPPHGHLGPTALVIAAEGNDAARVATGLGQWAVAHAESHDVVAVRVGDHEWLRGEAGWHATEAAAPAATVQVFFADGT